MRPTRFAMLIAVPVIAILWAASAVRSEDAKRPSAAAQKAPTPQEMMAAMAKYGTPGPEHERLQALVGTFDAELAMQMAPDAPPATSHGRMVYKSIFGGRFVHGDFAGDFNGQPFTGAQLLGYDRLKGKYTSHWIDSMSTTVQSAEGDADADGKVITVVCTFDCPIVNVKKTMRQVLTLTDADHHTFESYDVGADGKEVKTMTIKYTRVKG